MGVFLWVEFLQEGTGMSVWDWDQEQFVPAGSICDDTLRMSWIIDPIDGTRNEVLELSVVDADTMVGSYFYSDFDGHVGANCAAFGEIVLIRD